jgi:hypothetical protein
MDSKRGIGLQFVRQHPREFLRLSVRRVCLFWTAPDRSAWLWISLLAWPGVILIVWRRQFDAMFFMLVMVFFPLVYYVTHVRATFRHPMGPRVPLIACEVIVTIGDRSVGSV